MGTSVSNPGPGSGVPLIPPWVEDPDAQPSNEDDESLDPETEEPASLPAVPTPLAPIGRFKGARANLGKFAQSGSGGNLRRGLGHYVRTGLGGSGIATRRMAGSARKAGALYVVLHELSGGRAPENLPGLDPAQLAGRPAREIVDRIAEALSPSDGTQDSEASRNSISQALSELIQSEPTLDLTSLRAEQTALAVQLFIGAEIQRRIDLDIGKSIFEKAPNPATAIRRSGEMGRYVRQVVARIFRLKSTMTLPLTHKAATAIANRVIKSTMTVFESYLH